MYSTRLFGNTMVNSHNGDKSSHSKFIIVCKCLDLHSAALSKTTFPQLSRIKNTLNNNMQICRELCFHVVFN